MYNQAIKNIRIIVENTNQSLQNIKKGEDLAVRSSATKHGSGQKGKRVI